MLKKIIKEFGQSLGIVRLPVRRPQQAYKPDDYQLKGDAVKELVHLEYLYKLDANENERLNLLESKTSQLIAQTGIIFSLLSLFVPLLIDKVVDVALWLKIILSLLLFFGFISYLLTINNALKNFNVNKFNYCRPAARNVISFQNKELAEFYNEVIQDLIYCLKENIEINNVKATNLLHSYTSFRLANLFMAILVGTFCLSMFFFRQKDPSVVVKGAIEVRDLNKHLEMIHKVIIAQDTQLHKNLEEKAPVMQKDTGR